MTASSYTVSFLDKNLANNALIVSLTAGFHVLHKNLPEFARDHFTLMLSMVCCNEL